MYSFCIYQGIYAKLRSFEIKNKDELKQILTDERHVNKVNKIRELYSRGEEEEANKLKLSLYNTVCPGVIDATLEFNKANVEPNDYILLDFDHMSADLTDRLVKTLTEKRKVLNIKFIQFAPRHCTAVNNGSLHVIIGPQTADNTLIGDAWLKAQADQFMQTLRESVPDAQCDPATLAYGRRMFLTRWEDIVYISSDFFEMNSKVNPFRKPVESSSSASTQQASSKLQPKEASYKGVPLDAIAESYCIKAHGSLETPGEAHATLVDVIHTLTCLTTDEQELYYAVRHICTKHDDADKQRVCCDAKKMAMSLIPKSIKDIVAQLSSTANASPVDTPLPEPTPAPAEPQSSSATLCTHTCAMPQALPAGVKAFLNIFPENLREMALNLLLGGLQLYCSFETVGTTGGAEPVVLDVCSVGDFGSGKTAVYKCVSKYITARVKAKDAAERAKLEAWRQQKVQKNNSGSISAQPKVHVRIFSNASRNQILSYAVNQPGVTMLVSTDEAQPLAMAERRSNFSNISELLRQGYNNGTLSNDTLSTTSCNASSEVKCGSLICSQSAYVYDMYGDGFDGLASRVIFHLQASPSLETLKRGYENFKFPDAAGVAVIEQMLDTLSSATGAFDLKGTKRVLQNWFGNIIDEYQEELKCNPDKADKTRIMLAPRCIQSALRAATMMYVLDGQRESKLVTDFALYIASKSLESLWVLYGDKIKENKFNEAINKKAHEYKKISTNSILLGLLPEVFNVEDMQKALAHEHMASASQNASNRISIMLKAKLIEKKGKGQWKKSIISK